MAESPSKRHREETDDVVAESEDLKRHKSYTQILSLLEEEEDEPDQQDFSSILTTLQRELSCDDPLYLPSSESEPDRENPTAGSSSATSEFSPAEEEDERERVMRHLLEASDDELGIPNRMDGGDEEEVMINGEDALSLGDGLWEFEDEAASYYTLLQSELFRG